jgi:predicted phage-related endonuclease
MKIHNLIQGSPEWKAYRAEHFNASDAPAMMGVSPYKSRGELLRELHTGVAADIDSGTQKRFDNGHRTEALARPLAEEFIGAELYPVTGSEGKLSASFDGLTLEQPEGFEHKALNNELRKAFGSMLTIAPEHRETVGCRELPIYHRIQMEQQLLISGAQRIMFMASQWTADEELVEEQHCWYYPDAKLRAEIVAGWAQFEKDLATYTLPEAVAPAPVGKAPESLPALRIEVTGKVTASNLVEFKETALAAIRSVNRELTTDAHFADAEKAVKWCADVETRLEAAKQHALSQTASIDALFKAIDDISAEARLVRLDLGKLVTRRKDEVKDEAVSKARAALLAHVLALNGELSPASLRMPDVDFPGAIKGKRSIDSMQQALDTMLATGKIAADTAARTVRTNLAAYRERAAGFESLFPDLAQIAHKAVDDFSTLLQARIEAHKAAEAEKVRKAQEAEAERKRQAEAAEAARVAAAALQAAASPAAPVQQAAPIAAPVETASRVVAAKPPEVNRPDEPATLKLGTIRDRLGFALTAEFLLETLGIRPARTEGAAKLYRESDFSRVCAALHQHIDQVLAGAEA